jgi:hypothetical protein
LFCSIFCHPADAPENVKSISRKLRGLAAIVFKAFEPRARPAAVTPPLLTSDATELQADAVVEVGVTGVRSPIRTIVPDQ